MLIYILLLCFILMLIGSYFLFKKEIMQPSLIFMFMYTVSVFCAIYNIEAWGIEMSKLTFILLLLGAAEFILVSYITKKIFTKKTKHETEKIKMKKIEIPRWITLAVIFCCLMVIFFQFVVVLNISTRYEPFSGFSRALTVYKEHTSYNKDVSLPSSLTMMQCFVLAAAFSYTLIFMNNFFLKKEREEKLRYIKENWIYLVPAVLFVITYLIQSNRGMIIDFTVGVVTIGILLWSQSKEWKKTIKIKSMIKLGIVGVLGLVIFYYSAAVVGRINTKGMLDYITFYCGGSIECFNQYVKNDKQIKMVRGEETFYSLILNLDSVGITDYELGDRETGHLEFLFHEGNLVGNIYTAYRRWLNDYGILGMLILQGIMAAVMTLLYEKIKHNSGKFGNMWILIYGYLSYTIYMHPMDGYLYFEVLSKAGIARFGITVVGYYILENWNNLEKTTKDKLLKLGILKKEENEISRKKNKALVFGITENPGGVESVIMNYYRHIDREKVQFDFLCNTEVVAYEDEILSLGGKVYRITARSKDREKYTKDMTEFFEKHAKEYSAIWVNVCSLANIDYLKYAKKYKIEKRIIHSHNSKNMDSFLRGMLHRFNKFFIESYATDFWTCSEKAGKWFYYRAIRKGNKYQVINNAIDTESYKYNEKVRKEVRKKLGIENKFVVGNVGRLHFQKNQIFLLDIFKEICEKNKDAYLLICGQGEEEEKLKSRAKELQIEDKVNFLGVIDNVEEVLQAMDALVMPSLFEGLAVILLEAQAASLKVFASKKVIPKLVKMSNDFEFISLEKDAEEWAEIIVNECNDKKDKREDRRNTIRKMGFDIEIEAKKMQKYFEGN